MEKYWNFEKYKHVGMEKCVLDLVSQEKNGFISEFPPIPNTLLFVKSIRCVSLFRQFLRR